MKQIQVYAPSNAGSSVKNRKTYKLKNLYISAMSPLAFLVRGEHVLQYTNLIGRLVVCIHNMCMSCEREVMNDVPKTPGVNCGCWKSLQKPESG